ncbi:MAG: hypothetical protein AUJ49_05155 [Desulfovibrionaceae bacterium CG1_02_65_16]|nr:MAG: hypothetical protein AUJ49_05155 [Desulfovibrionaceae bacterium CG1_02_65_16]
MDELNQSFTDFQTLATESVARGERFSGLAAAFAEASRRIAHPAALLDAGLVYLSMNEPYARMLRLPPSALVGREYS